MLKKQQKQTLQYFDKIYLKWHKRAIFNKKNRFDTINERNNFVLNFIKKSRVKKFLDVGCGSGELVNSASKLSVKSTGIDFSKKMISLANKKYKENSFRTFEAVDIDKFFKLKNKKYNLISANGFFEYFSEKKMQYLFNSICKKLEKKGYFIGSFRNRLFNLYSLNQFTTNELKNKNVEKLLEEAVLINKLKTSELIKKNYKNKKFKNISHPETGGVKVSTRFQYTPLQIMDKLKKEKFETKYIYPINLHLVNPKIKDKKNLEILKHSALKFYVDKRINSLIFQSSTFMVLAQKK